MVSTAESESRKDGGEGRGASLGLHILHDPRKTYPWGVCNLNNAPDRDYQSQGNSHFATAESRRGRNVHLSISRDSLAKLLGAINFSDSTLLFKSRREIQLSRTPSFHLVIRGCREDLGEQPPLKKNDQILGNQVGASTLDVPDAELSKIDLR